MTGHGWRLNLAPFQLMDPKTFTDTFKMISKSLKGQKLEIVFI
jgi:hypothetical protein